MPKLHNILMLSHGLGSYYRARGYAPHLVRRGYQVEIVTISQRNRWRPLVEEIEGARVIHSPDLLWGRLRTGWDPWDCAWRMLDLLRRPVDLIKCYETRPVTLLPAFALKRLLKVPVVTSWGDWWGRGGTTFERSTGWSHQLDRVFSPVETFFEESFHRYADGMIVLSEALRKRAVALGVPDEKIRTIIPGVDLERVRPGDRAAARQALGIPQDRFLYGYAGKIFPRDAALLMEAHGKVAAQVPDATVVLIGHSNYRGGEGRPSAVITTGGGLSYSTVLQWFAACDVMLLPLADSVANRGRWPSKVAEYMAAERAVVATAVGDVTRLFTDGRAGVLTAPDASSFAEGILRLYGDSKREAMGRTGRAIAREQLQWSTQADRIQDFLECVYEDRNAPATQPEYA